ncbi:MAG: hypothetical protein J0L56_13015 [Chitinophagales bacterium]|nr:hypothetical protein [Chitinophagales bacterium]
MKEQEIENKIQAAIREEKDTSFNPFLATRIMVAIEKERTGITNTFIPVWKKIVVAMSLLVAIAAGYYTGNLYKRANYPDEVVLINDYGMEQLEFYKQGE